MKKHIYIVSVEKASIKYYNYFEDRNEAQVFMQVAKKQHPDAIIECDL